MSQSIKNIFRRIIYTISYMVSLVFKKDFDGFVLCYHSIEDDGWEFSIPIEKFKKQIEFLLQNYQPIDIKDFEEYVNNNRTFSKPFFLVTFDDGYKSIYQLKEYLKEKEIHPLVFLLSKTEKVNHEEIDNNYDFLSSDQTKELLKNGWDFGSHGATHEDMFKMEDEKIHKEMAESRQELENRLGIKIECFAYPRGRYSQKCRNMVKNTGYKMAFSMDSKLLSSNVDVFAVPRVGVMNTHSFMEFKSLPLPLSTCIRNMYFRKAQRK